MADKQVNNLLGKKIKELWLKNNLSQDELVRKADVPYTTRKKLYYPNKDKDWSN